MGSKRAQAVGSRQQSESFVVLKNTKNRNLRNGVLEPLSAFWCKFWKKHGRVDFCYLSDINMCFVHIICILYQHFMHFRQIVWQTYLQNYTCRNTHIQGTMGSIDGFRTFIIINTCQQDFWCTRNTRYKTDLSLATDLVVLKLIISGKDNKLRSWLIAIFSLKLLQKSMNFQVDGILYESDIK